MLDQPGLALAAIAQVLPGECIRSWLQLHQNMSMSLIAIHTAHFLDFKGRVTKPSLKNFQLVHWDHNANHTGTDLMMMFGKKGHDEYVMDFSYPLNTLQAFGLGEWWQFH